MTSSRPQLVSLPLDFPELQIPGFEIIWAGEGPREQAHCIGSEDGRVVFNDSRRNGSAWDRLPSLIQPEAINGVAFGAGVMAVSTRNEVVFWNVPGPESRN